MSSRQLPSPSQLLVNAFPYPLRFKCMLADLRLLSRFKVYYFLLMLPTKSCLSLIVRFRAAMSQLLVCIRLIVAHFLQRMIHGF
jgi:hypothetical protein